jgi:hypothetical protein
MATLDRLCIEPIGTSEADGAYTEHIEVRLQTDAEPVMEESVPAEPAPVQPGFQFGQVIPRERSRRRSGGAAQRVPPLGFAQPTFPAPIPVNATSEAVVEDASLHSGTGLVSASYNEQITNGSGGVFADLESIVVEAGDLVFIRYNDQSDRRLSIRLSDAENDPGNGVVHVSQPLGTAILGASLDEEIAVKIGNRTRTAMIEKIEKPRPVSPLAAE